MLAAAATSTTIAAADSAAAPHDLNAQTDGSHVFITWRAAGPTPPDAFVLEAGTAPGQADLAIVNIPWGAERGFEASFTATGVAPGVYFVRVREKNGDFISAPSSDLEMRVGHARCPLPYAPRNLTASVDRLHVTLTWDPPREGASPVGYVIEAGSQPGVPDTAIISIATMPAISVQAPPGRYFVRVRTMGQCGSSEPSSELVVTVP